MPTPAHYAIVVGDKAERIAAPNSPTGADFAFDLPSDIEALGSLGSAVLQIVARPGHDPDDLHVKILINGTEVFVYGPSSETLVRSFHAVFNGGILVPGQNTMRVHRFGVGTGSFGFSDVVVWYGLRLMRAGGAARPKYAARIRARRTAAKTSRKKTSRKKTKRRA
jgi:hypothetical protein